MLKGSSVKLNPSRIKVGMVLAKVSSNQVLKSMKKEQEQSRD